VIEACLAEDPLRRPSARDVWAGLQEVLGDLGPAEPGPELLAPVESAAPAPG
jgi:hypothetical protein